MNVTRHLTANRLLYPEYRTKLITERMHRSLKQRQQNKPRAGLLARAAATFRAFI